MASAAAAHRAASPLLLLAAATTTTTPLATGTSSLRSAATTILGHVPPSAAATPHLLTGAATATTTTPLAAGIYSLRSATTAILGRRSVFCTATLHRHATLSAAFSSPATLHRHATRFVSTALLGNRSVASSPAYLANAGSMLARRGVSTETFTPELQQELQRLEKASASRHEDLKKQLDTFELEIMATYSAGKLSSDETALTAGKVAWRVSTAVLAFGITTIVAVLQTIKDGWKVDFHTDVRLMLEDMLEKLKVELLVQLRQVVRTEMDLIEAEKAAKKK